MGLERPMHRRRHALNMLNGSRTDERRARALGLHTVAGEVAGEGILGNEEGRGATGESDDCSDRGFSGKSEHDVSPAFEAGWMPMPHTIRLSGTRAVRKITLRRARRLNAGFHTVGVAGRL